jgi:hypothetical protein
VGTTTWNKCGTPKGVSSDKCPLTCTNAVSCGGLPLDYESVSPQPFQQERSFAWSTGTPEVHRDSSRYTEKRVAC